MEEWHTLRFIGVVESGGEISRVRIFEEFLEGLDSLDNFSHLILLYWFHLREEEKEREVLKVVPRRHREAPEVGVFASRSPSRPNLVGLCVVELVKIEGSMLYVKELDAFEGSPVIDIKPYMPKSNAFPSAKVPKWALHGPKT